MALQSLDPHRTSGRPREPMDAHVWSLRPLSGFSAQRFGGSESSLAGGASTRRVAKSHKASTGAQLEKKLVARSYATHGGGHNTIRC